MKLRAWIHMVVTLGLLLGPWTGGLRLRPSVQAAPSAATWYVKPGENGACTSWADACELQAALGVAGSGDEIWVAAGTYLPDYNPTGGKHTGDRRATLQFKNGVEIYGGFAGMEDSRDQRDWETHITTLSGDIGTLEDDSDNSYHVVTGGGTGTTAVLDGVTISDGHASGPGTDSQGGGMYNRFGNPKVANVIFSNNKAGYGGGMFNHGGSPELSNVTFVENGASLAESRSWLIADGVAASAERSVGPPLYLPTGVFHSAATGQPTVDGPGPSHRCRYPGNTSRLSSGRLTALARRRSLPSASDKVCRTLPEPLCIGSPSRGVSRREATRLSPASA